MAKFMYDDTKIKDQISYHKKNLPWTKLSSELCQGTEKRIRQYDTIFRVPVGPGPHFSSIIRFWKSETIRGKPCFSEILGSQLRRDLALEMSGFLMCGSSAVLGLNSTDAPGSIVSFTTCGEIVKCHHS